MTRLSKVVSRFLGSEAGSASWFSVVPLIFVLIILGLGLDVTNATQERTHLQVTADAAAHAALVTRNRIDSGSNDYFSEAEAKAKGIELAEMNMPPAQKGNVLNAGNVVFGEWNSTTRTFTPNPGSQNAVQVVTEQVSANGNPVSTYLLRLIGFNTWDVRALTTMARFGDQCSEKDFGFFSNGIIDIQSNNTFQDCFCIHSNTHVEFQQNNTFEQCASVTMPNPDDLVVPGGDMSNNPGLAEALGSDGYTIQEVEKLAETINGLDKAVPDYTEGQSPEFLKNISGIHNIDAKKVNVGPANLVEGMVNRVTCGNNNKVSIQNDAVIQNVVIITDCMVEFGSGSSMKNSIIASRSTNAKAVDGPKGIQIGGHECGTPGGNAVILTLGGAHFAASLSFKSGQIVAKGDVQMAAQDISIAGGAAVYAGGRIDATSNLVMQQTCDDGSETNFTEAYFRIVE